MRWRVTAFVTCGFAPALSGVCAGPETAAVADEGAEEVVAEVRRMQDEKGLRPAWVGFCAIGLEEERAGESGFGYQEERAMVPASTMKVVTTATALAAAGEGHRFVTLLERAGEIGEDGALAGDVVVRGGGDPTLGASGIAGTYAKWAEALAEAGVKKVGGSVVGDASVFGDEPVADTWAWNDFGNYFGSGASGLTFHRNQFYCTFRPGGAVGAAAALVGTDPKLPGIEFVNEMRTGPAGSGDKGFIYGHPLGKTYFLRGTVPLGEAAFTIRGSLPEPALFCARGFTKHLSGAGIEVVGEPTTVRLLGIAGKKVEGERVEIYRQESAPLGSLIASVNQKSLNLEAECLHRLIGVKLGGEGTTLAASRAVGAYWEGRGVGLEGFVMADGCGLSRANLISARQLAEILHAAAGSEFGEVFLKSLPVAGRSGTLRGIGRGSAAEGRVAAKSGTIGGVKCYAGYLTARSGKRYAFALMVNNYACSEGEVKAKIVRVWEKMVGSL